MIRKSDDTPLLFNDVMMAKRENDDISDENMIDPNDTPSSLLPRLNEMVQAMVVADPSMSEEQHLFSILHTARGRALASHLATLNKRKDDPPMIDIMKVIAFTEKCLMAKATDKLFPAG